MRTEQLNTHSAEHHHAVNAAFAALTGHKVSRSLHAASPAVGVPAALPAAALRAALPAALPSAALSAALPAAGEWR